MNEKARWMLVIWLALAGQTYAQWHKPGEFPAGHYYTENELQNLVGAKITQPAYLIGNFILLSVRENQAAIFTAWDKGLVDANGISFPSIFVLVQFHDNMPPNPLHTGVAIVPNERDPLTLIKVIKGPVEHSAVAITESWSAPEKTGEGN